MNEKIDRKPGLAVEILIFRLHSGTERELVDHLTEYSCPEKALRAHRPGRYRVEWRDERRWIVRAQGFTVSRQGDVNEIPKGYRLPRKRTITSTPRDVLSFRPSRR